MRLRTLAAEVAFLDVLLGIVPGTTARGHGDRHEEAGDDGADQEATQGLDARPRPHDGIEDEYEDDRHQDGKQGRDDHLADGGLREQVHGSRVVRLARAFHDSLDLAELAPDLVDHRAGRPADGFHGHGAEQVGHQAADEQADDDGRVGE